MDEELEEFTVNFLLDLILINRGELEYVNENYLKRGDINDKCNNVVNNVYI